MNYFFMIKWDLIVPNMSLNILYVKVMAVPIRDRRKQNLTAVSHYNSQKGRRKETAVKDDRSLHGCDVLSSAVFC